MIIRGVNSNREILPILLGTNGEVMIDGSNIALLNPTALADGQTTNLTSGGAVNTDMITVPIGEKWDIGLIVSYYSGTVAGVRLLPYVNIGGNNIFIASFSNITTATFYPVNPFMVLDEGNIIGLRCTGATNGDNIQQYCFGRKI